MKKISYILIFLLLVSVHACEFLDDQSDQQLRYVSVEPGGCNLGIPDSMQKNLTVEKADTIHFSIMDDTLNAFVGLNYICCAPFETQAEIVADTFYITITDICDLSQETCYCRCNCYYFWNFKFTNVPSGILYYKISLFDPRIGDSMVYKKGDIILPIY